MAEQYRYDQLNRLVRSHTYAYDAATGFTGTANYHTGYSYDANGNLQTLGRNGYSTPGAATADNQLAMDALRYSYKPGTNQLVRVDDDVVPLNPDRYQDIRPASSAVGTAQYTYDAIGNLVSTTAETGEGTSAIAWNVYGKMTQITQSKTDHNALVRRLTSFRYDAQGQRIAKVVQLGNDAGYTQTRTTYYVRDGQGNVLATYEQTTPSGGAAGAITLLEQHLYGSSRLGVRRPEASPALDPGYYARTLSQKQYELTDHLGNVRQWSATRSCRRPAARSSPSCWLTIITIRLVSCGRRCTAWATRPLTGATATATTARKRMIIGNSASRLTTMASASITPD
jgi:hypothetical protein